MSKDINELVGQRQLIRALEKIIHGRNFHHAYVFSGLDLEAVSSVTYWFAGMIGCLKPGANFPCGKCDSCLSIQHRDGKVLHFLEGTEQSQKYTVQAVRSIRTFLHLKPEGALPRILIIPSAETLNGSPANALLKLLEEPQPGVFIILTCLNIRLLIPTIRSRVANFNLLPVARKSLFNEFKSRGYSKDQITEALYLTAGQPNAALTILKNSEKFKSIREAEQSIKHWLTATVTTRFQIIANLFKNASDLQTQRIRATDFINSLAVSLTNEPLFSNSLRSFFNTVEAIKSNAQPKFLLEKLALIIPQKI
jgi:DNA polymerase III delta prime subunit